MSALGFPVKEDTVLLEAGQGKNLNGNMFAVLRELCTNPKWKKMKPVFIVTADNQEDAAKRFAFYGYQVRLVIRNSKEYGQILATAKYLLTDNSFPPYFCKRDDQVYMNTWHGTPLKTLGKSDINNAKSLANIQKNYLMSDFALFPNTFTENVFMKDYMLENIYKGKVVLCDYPRNSVFLDKEQAEKLRKTLGLEKKQLIAYMPTWRGTGRSADVDIQKEILETYFKEIDKKLNDDQIFYVNLHFLIGNTMDFSEYKHIRVFPKEYETYDFLAVCDMLVTDYSSVFFDFAVTKRKIVLFAYDLEEYMRDRGTYFPIEELPFPIVRDVSGLIEKINQKDAPENQKEFLDVYCNYSAPDVPEKVLELMVNGKTEGLHVCNAPDNGKKSVLIFGGKLRNKQVKKSLLNYLEERTDDEEKNIILCFNSAINRNTVAFLEQIPENMNYLAMVTKIYFSPADRIMAFLAIRNRFWEKCFDGHLKKAYEKERERLFYSIEPEEAVCYSEKPHYMYKILSTFQCRKTAHIHHNSVVGTAGIKRLYKNMTAYLEKHYDKICDHRNESASELWDDEEKQNYYNKCINIFNLCRHFHNSKDAMKMSSLVFVRTLLPFSLEKMKVRIGSQEVQSEVKRGIPLGKHVRLTTIRFTITDEQIKALEIQNPVRLIYSDSEGGLDKPIQYKKMRRRKQRNLHGPIKVYKDLKTSAYFRQTKANTLYLTVRKVNVTDSRKERVKLFLAYYLAKILPLGRKILLFEKESSRYEESASVLYEKLIDKGYSNAYFIIDKNYAHLDTIPEKYRKNLVYKTTFKHYLYFFKSQTFLGSESLVHAIDLRIINKCASKKLADKNLDYVFLQHGVMYMVSLDSESRKFFKPRRTNGKYRVVVSSEEEARHFTELGNYDPETIYVSGLPKFDRNVMNENADKIVIMPTWRPWEYNSARYEFFETKYYKMVSRIFSAIPEKYRDKIVILPHPLFFDAVKNSENELKKYFDFELKYDDILKHTKVLITDYSSIAYDAFYRGANVIFYWEEKDECLENYGPSTKLMLNDENVYGDICFNREDLAKVIEKNYREKQKSLYVERYRRIVQYHDGKNTERLVKMLEEDHII